MLLRAYKKKRTHIKPFNFTISVLTESEDLLETTVHQEEVYTVTSETSTTGSDTEDPKVVRRTEQTHKVTTRQRSRGNIFQSQAVKPITKIRVSPHNDFPQKHSEGSCCDHEETRFGHYLTTPRPGMPQHTAIGASS